MSNKCSLLQFAWCICNKKAAYTFQLKLSPCERFMPLLHEVIASLDHSISTYQWATSHCVVGHNIGCSSSQWWQVLQEGIRVHQAELPKVLRIYTKIVNAIYVDYPGQRLGIIVESAIKSFCCIQIAKYIKDACNICSKLTIARLSTCLLTECWRK